MIAAVAYTVTVLILLACIARGIPALRPGHVILRARWAWRCHGKPVPGGGPGLSYEEAKALYAIKRGLRSTHAAERSRT